MYPKPHLAIVSKKQEDCVADLQPAKVNTAKSTPYLPRDVKVTSYLLEEIYCSLQLISHVHHGIDLQTYRYMDRVSVCCGQRPQY